MSNEKRRSVKSKTNAAAKEARFIMEAGRVQLTGKPEWFLRQFTDDEHSEAQSAGRIAADNVRSNPRLAKIGDVSQEAERKYEGEYLAYILPLLVETKDNKPVFDVFDDQSMAEFNKLSKDVYKELHQAFWDAIWPAYANAKNG